MTDSPVLRRAVAPEQTSYWPPLAATMHTGARTALEAVTGDLLSRPPQRVGLDIETLGLGQGRWQITCVTFAWRAEDGSLVGVLLDPLRTPGHAEAVRDAIAHCSTVVLHNATFDIPILYSHDLIDAAGINKVEDTIILSRMVRTGLVSEKRTLEGLSATYGIIDDSSVKITAAMSAAGSATKETGYLEADIDRDFYRRGAMLDTLVTLTLFDALHADVLNTLRAGSAFPFAPARLDDAGARSLIEDMFTMHRITLRQSARGLALDRDYIARTRSTLHDEIEQASPSLTSEGLRPGVGADVIAHLDREGSLPDDWPRTDKGALKADKAAMAMLEKMGHPIAAAHTTIAEAEKNLNYLAALEESAFGTGRVHPATGVLGAHASGRMSVKDPALQQFSELARPAIVSDDGGDLWSADWSSIEPVVLATCAGDADFMAPLARGDDLYVPTAKAAGLVPPELEGAAAKEHPGRKRSKAVLLAAMYGQGLNSLAEQLGITPEDAKRVQSSIRARMPTTFSFMDSVQSMCAQTAASFTISGRVLDERMPDGQIKDRVAVNHFCQGSSADMLMAATLQMEKWGMADEIVLWIHDELVVTDAGVEAAKAAMLHPPEWLLYHARTQPVLDVDAQNMGRHWQKV